MSEVALATTSPESPHLMVARRVRGILAERQITGVRVASAMGLDQRTFSRRYRGTTPYTLNELFVLADVLGLSVADLIQVETQNGRPPVEDRPSRYGISDLNREPAD